MSLMISKPNDDNTAKSIRRDTYELVWGDFERKTSIIEMKLVF